MSGETTARILVADNDEDILTLVSFRLQRQGYEVLVARDGAEALELARAELPDLCVLDVMMPKLTGYDVTRELRADPRTADVPVILLTARVQEADVRSGYDAGADDYVRKPFAPQELRDRVAAALAKRRAA
ncbi:response regulator [Conexibacter sp. JD483]|uniref:response regulator transcription factor n=1 Tax=unclassified Conexibacter TaxID=2627773 RepID=UPI0027243618|nr:MULTISPECIES: response regulator [unclassified Conexibacter]MDO8184039.1 response regulator [Conexibacter sp. CPCC 205706]MDO8197031.1 response regulator [Conexibacter sp. CPCC 205762]MDR9367947.1 response regulator [Conexibacter sp. JD483]